MFRMDVNTMAAPNTLDRQCIVVICQNLTETRPLPYSARKISTSSALTRLNMKWQDGCGVTLDYIQAY